MGNKEKEKLLMIRFKEGNASGEQLVEYSEIAPETIGPNMTKDVEDAWTKEGWNDALTNLINNGLVVFTFSDAFECIYGLPENIPENPSLIFKELFLRGAGPTRPASGGPASIAPGLTAVKYRRIVKLSRPP